MNIYNKRLPHDRQLYARPGISTDMWRRVMRELAQRGGVIPKRSPNGRVFISINEAERLHKTLVPPLSCWMRD